MEAHEPWITRVPTVDQNERIVGRAELQLGLVRVPSPLILTKLRVATSQILGYRMRPYEGLGIFKMGRRACYLWCPAFRLCIDPFCYFPDCALVAAALHGSDLFHQHLLEY